ncbi:hypothetical protein A5753_00740 [Mycobacterium sp. 852002-51971_SCH5477799-a]|uniref:hypothetical protein n=1 Tax=Mycobacterium sp. 852002-51971_SCH5477799-a TaxID=1834106 RepID=UPI0007FC139F|nr:hypothetical protein [Mycobacterium sp. 852002-51971_SCH5477799-a]OBF65857.1 hypothetical protein A5753_00740 [Mycobacterium sp. 852002-51971_SCH5477799-a]
MAAESGLLRVGGVVVLSGPALRATLQGQLIAIRQRRMSGLPTGEFEDLAAELHAAMTAQADMTADDNSAGPGNGMAANGHSDMRLLLAGHPVPVEPTVPLAEAAARLGISRRQARRLARRLGGDKIAGRWLVDELALRQHIEGKS